MKRPIWARGEHSLRNSWLPLPGAVAHSGTPGTRRTGTSSPSWLFFCSRARGSRRSAPPASPLLPLEAGVDGQLALTLQGDALAIQPAGQHHPAKESPEVLGVEADVGVTDGRAVGSQDPLRLGAGPVHGRLVGRLGHG